MSKLVTEYCKQLKLGNLARNMHEVPFTSPAQYLETLLALEVADRSDKRVKRLLKNAGFPAMKTLERFQWSNVMLPESLDRQDLIQCKFIDDKDNIIAVGPVGTGKTHLSTALGVQACRQGKKVQFYTAARLVNQLLDEHQRGTKNRFMKSIYGLDLLIIDELGFVPFHKDGSELLFEVISESYEHHSLVITTNLEFGYWNSVFGDKKLTAALIDRLIHHAHFLVFSGESYRFKESVKRQRTDGAVGNKDNGMA